MMPNSPAGPRPFRFGTFELDLSAGGLRKQGLKVKLQEQPMQILALLLERPGQVVTRDELRKRLWPDDTFVDFDHSLNKAVNKLRDALEDSADHPHFIETVPKRGYRFIAEVTLADSAAKEVRASPSATARNQARFAAVLLAVALCVLAVLWVRKGSPFLTRAASTSIRSVAVLPLKSLSNGPGQEYFADDMTDALTADLSRISGLTVLSESSAQRYRDSSKPPAQIARELSVDAVIAGTVQRTGDRIRVSTQIVAGPGGRELWSQRFEREMSDVLVLQAEVASAIAEHVKKELTAEEKASFERRPVVDPRAYEDYLKGDHYWAKFTEEDWKKSKQYFLEAIRLDPRYAPPYRALAGVLMTEHQWYGIGEDNMEDAKALANKAVALDPLMADGHIGLGWILFQSWDLEGAEREFRRAVALAPGHAYALLSLQHTLILRGRMQDAVPQLERVKGLDPVAPQVLVFIGLTEYLLREYDRGMGFCQESVEIEPDFAMGHYCLGKMLLAERKPDQAVAEFRLAREKGGDAIPYVSGLGQAQAAAGAREAAKATLKQLEANPSGQKYYYAALVQLALGNKQQALTALEKAYTAHSSDLIYLETEPAWDSQRGEPRFGAVATNLSEAIAESGRPTGKKDVSIAALEAYVQGQHHAEQAEGLAYRKGSSQAQREELKTARTFYEQAIQEDPGYAQAYVGLARTWADLTVAEGGPAKAESLLRKAIQLDPQSAEGHEALATLDVLRLWRWTEAEQEYKRAIALNPTSAEAHARYAEYLDCMKRFDEGMSEFLKAQQLDPGHSFQPNPFYRRRQYDRAIRVDEGEVKRQAFGFWPHLDLAFDYEGAGKHEEAAREWEEVLRELGYADLADEMHGGMQKSGSQGALKALVAGLEAADAHGEPPPSFLVAMIYAELGQKDRAFYWLERGYRERSPSYSALNVDPCWDPLRSDARFKDLVRRVGLPQ